jgi:hypothetical protein
MKDEAMKHLTQEELVLFYYGEGEGAAAHLHECESCRREYQALQRTLNAVDSLPIPERVPGYEAQVWRRVSPKLPLRAKRSFWWRAPVWAVAAGLLIGAFFLGRVLPPDGFVSKPVRQAANPNNERLLQAAVGDHLDRSQMVLREIVNSTNTVEGTRDISYEQQIAEDLVDANRLFRALADTTGDRATAALLDDLERVLLEVAHSPAQLSGYQFQDLKNTIEDQGLLFKVRVYQTQVQEREKTI